MTILGIETSCDDTGIAIVQARGKRRMCFRILSNVVSSQVNIHRKYGGVYPFLAKREHEKNLPVVLKRVLKEAGFSLTKPKIDAISITQGPGLSPCLWTGLNFAKALAKKWGIPLLPIDHMEGHLLVGLFSQTSENPKCQMPNAKNIFPAVALLVSGGHTQIILVKSIGNYELLGETRDDAAGEAFDKTARILGLSFPGGPAIARQAALPKLSLGAPKLSLGIRLPRPMLHTKDLDFSFSGLKTAVLYDFQSRTKKIQESKEYVGAMAKEIQQAIVDVLLTKTLKAAHRYKAKSIILGGGVAANDELRTQLKKKVRGQKLKLKLLVPSKELSTDNGVMAALAGHICFLRKDYPRNPLSIEAQPNLRLE